MDQDQELEKGTDVGRQVGAALAEDHRTADMAIEVVAQGGVVTLAGQVANRDLRQAAEEVASGQPGVVQVINDLAVIGTDEDKDLPGVSPMAYRESRPPIIPEPEP